MNLRSTAFSLIAIVPTITACDTTVPEPGAVTSSALTASEQDAVVESVAFDPVFVAYAETAIRVANKASASVVPLDANGRAQVVTQLDQLRLDIDAGAPPAVVIPRLTSITSVTNDDMLQLRARGQALSQRFPGLSSTGPAFFGQAIEMNPALSDLLTFDHGGSGDDGDEQLRDCLRDCDEELTRAHNTNIAIFAVETAVCTGLVVFPPVSAACFATAMANSVIREAYAMDDFDDCQDMCHGRDPDGECEADSDCPRDEWCDTGTLSVGDNVCKPDKSIGQVCSRDAKCASGCCKYDFWQHPVSMTCNPASDCN